ncbi:SAM-dependent methyltransferase [Catenulispora yoronensis]|uniref:SAM-dependent methyltransferase n=1 Tax=Catenulispora yoronensis TaxID=450799 RepID=A0ABP5G295_9ACTN
MTDRTGAHRVTGAAHEAEPLFDDLPPNIDTDVFSVARLYDFLLGGKHNFAPDREFGRRLLAIEPNGRMILQQNRLWLARAMRVLLAAGVRQFLDLGSGIPTQHYVHELAHAVDPGAKVVYVDNDPPAVSHSNYILRDSPNAGAAHADMAESERVLAHPTVTSLIDFGQPVAITALAAWHFVEDKQDPKGVLAEYRRVLAPGSYLALTHATIDGATGDLVRDVQSQYQSVMKNPSPRTREQIADFFEGFDILDPGIVNLPAWRPDKPQDAENAQDVWFYGALGRLAA